MRVEEVREQRIVEDVFKKYIADDGTEFDNERDCEKYEKQQREKEARKELTLLRDHKLDDICPLTDDPDQLSHYSDWRWYWIDNKEEAKRISNLYYKAGFNTFEVGRDCPDTDDDYPIMLCVEECDGECYTYTLDNIMKFVGSYFSNCFNMEVIFKRKEELNGREEAK